MQDLALAREFLSILPRTYGVALDLVMEALKDAPADFVRLEIELTYTLGDHDWTHQVGYRFMVMAFNEAVLTS